MGVTYWPNQGPQTVNVYAGEVLPIAAYLVVSAGGCTFSGNRPECLDNGGSTAPFATGDADGTAWFYIDEVDGATYTSDSGTRYASAVTATPEPGSAGLLLTGLAGIGACFRWRRTARGGRTPARDDPHGNFSSSV